MVVIFFSQYASFSTEFNEVYESILLKLKEKYSDKNIFYKLHPCIEREEWKQELDFHLDFAKKYNLKTSPGFPQADKMIKDNLDSISATYSIDSSVINTSLKYNIPSYHLYGVFISNRISHPYRKIDDPTMFGWEYLGGEKIFSPLSVKWEDSFIIKNNKLYLNVTDLSQIGSIDDIIVGDNERPKLKWDDLSWDKT